MACISPDGSPTSSGLRLLEALAEGSLTAAEITSQTGEPLFKVRANVRKMVTAGLVSEEEGRYALAEGGRALL